MSKKNLLYLLLSIVLAFGMWLYVITVVNPESEETFYDVPVVLKNMESLQDKELMLILEENPTVTLDLIGNRTDLVRLNKSDITVMVDLARIYEPGEHELNYSVSFPANEGGGAISLQNKKPANLKITVERKIIDKPVDVVVDAQGFVPGDCIVQEEIFSSRQVLVSGPKSVVDQITQARISVDYENKEKTFTQVAKPTLCDANGQPVDAQLVETDIGSVEVTVVVQKIKEVALKVTVVDGGGATSMTSDVNIEPKKIKVSGTEEDLAGLDTLELGTINLADYPLDTTKEFPIKLPAGVKDLGNNETASVSIKFPDLNIVELTVTEFEAANVPEDMEEEILAQALTVRIRGPKTQMAQITGEDVKIVVDLKGSKPGTFNAAAKVVITNSAFSTAGALGTYSVTVSLTEK